MGRLWKSGCQQYFPLDMGTFPRCPLQPADPTFVLHIQIFHPIPNRLLNLDLSTIQICSPFGFSFVNPSSHMAAGGNGLV